LSPPRANLAVAEVASLGAGSTAANTKQQRQPPSQPATVAAPHDVYGDSAAAAAAHPAPPPPRLKQSVLPPVLQEAYVENRLLTPSQHRARPHHVPALPLGPDADQLSPLREFGTQTDESAAAAPPGGGHRRDAAAARGDGDVAAGGGRKARGSKSKGRATVAEANGDGGSRAAAAGEEAAAEAAEPRKPWGYRNKQRQQYVKQSERDVDFERKRDEEAERRAQRERKILKLVEANSPRVPANAASRPTRPRAAPAAGGPPDAGRSKVTASR